MDSPFAIRDFEIDVGGTFWQRRLQLSNAFLTMCDNYKALEDF